MLHHSAWLLNRFLRQAVGKTSRERNWQRPYTQAILKFGARVHIDNLMAEHMKLHQRNSQQKYGLELFYNHLNLGPQKQQYETIRLTIPAQHDGATTE
eukprot:3447626-Amphidinium_carterae.1